MASRMSMMDMLMHFLLGVHREILPPERVALGFRQEEARPESHRLAHQRLAILLSAWEQVRADGGDEWGKRCHINKIVRLRYSVSPHGIHAQYSSILPTV